MKSSGFPFRRETETLLAQRVLPTAFSRMTSKPMPWTLLSMPRRRRVTSPPLVAHWGKRDMQGNARKRYLSLRQTDDDDQALFRTLNPQDSCFAAAVVLRASVRHTAADKTTRASQQDQVLGCRSVQSRQVGVALWTRFVGEKVLSPKQRLLL